MGHSAGAQLVALVGTDGRYAEKAGLKLSDLSRVILLDGAGYDIPRQVRQAVLPRLSAMCMIVFTENEATQRDASPITHFGKDKGIPPRGGPTPRSTGNQGNPRTHRQSQCSSSWSRIVLKPYQKLRRGEGRYLHPAPTRASSSPAPEYGASGVPLRDPPCLPPH